MIPGRSRLNLAGAVGALAATSQEDLDRISTNSVSEENQWNYVGLVRSRTNSGSFSSHGYFGLAVVFCIMCCTSFISGPAMTTNLNSFTIANGNGQG